jgi:hypothetical protein
MRHKKLLHSTSLYSTPIFHGTPRFHTRYSTQAFEDTLTVRPACKASYPTSVLRTAAMYGPQNNTPLLYSTTKGIALLYSSAYSYTPSHRASFIYIKLNVLLYSAMIYIPLLVLYSTTLISNPIFSTPYSTLILNLQYTFLHPCTPTIYHVTPIIHHSFGRMLTAYYFTQ